MKGSSWYGRNAIGSRVLWLLALLLIVSFVVQCQKKILLCGILAIGRFSKLVQLSQRIGVDHFITHRKTSKASA